MTFCTYKYVGETRKIHFEYLFKFAVISKNVRDMMKTNVEKFWFGGPMTLKNINLSLSQKPQKIGFNGAYLFYVYKIQILKMMTFKIQIGHKKPRKILHLGICMHHVDTFSISSYFYHTCIIINTCICMWMISYWNFIHICSNIMRFSY